MKNAQDAVREIKEWPKLDFEYLVQHEDGSIGFVDYVPPVVVCTKAEFMEAKSSAVKSVEDAVRVCRGVWPTESVNHLGMGRGWSGGYVGDEPDFLAIDATCTKVTRVQFEAEARRQGYVDGFEGHPDDCAFKGEYRPSCQDVCMGWWDDGRVCWHRVLVLSHHPDDNGFMACMMLGGEWKTKLFWTDKFEPLKSDRERWVEAADKLVSTVDAGPYVMLETVYDALKSGELPTPEAK